MQTNLKKARENASKIGVTVKPSTVKNKKLDVFKNDKKIASIGDIRYADYLTHNDDKRKENYLKRHAKTRSKIGTPSYYAAKILWS
jgi:hypothetical protein